LICEVGSVELIVLRRCWRTNASRFGSRRVDFEWKKCPARGMEGGEQKSEVDGFAQKVIREDVKGH
jgi:hypothetical protein